VHLYSKTYACRALASTCLVKLRVGSLVRGEE
jgi:hypothetical protein